MATKVSICNMALTHVGAKALIANLDTDTSIEAKVCRVYYDEAVRFVLSQAEWGFAKATVALALLEETDPTEEWDYLYSVPSDCIKFRQIPDKTASLSNYYSDDNCNNQRSVQPKKIPYEIKLNAAKTQKVIFTNEDQAYGHYTANVTDPTLFPTAFSFMVSYHLGSLIAYALTKKKNVKDDMLTAFERHKLIAAVNDAEEQEETELPDSEFISTRN